MNEERTLIAVIVYFLNATTGEASNLRFESLDYGPQPEEHKIEYYSGEAMVIPRIDDLHVDPYKTQKENEDFNKTIYAKLDSIDLKSIRSMREYISALPDAPQYLKDYENEAKEERKKIKK